MGARSKRDNKAEAVARSSTATPAAGPGAGPTFEEALARLEGIAHKLESGDLPLDEAIALAEEGIALAQRCEQQLTAAEGKIQQLVERMGKVELEPLAPGADEEE